MVNLSLKCEVVFAVGSTKTHMTRVMLFSVAQHTSGEAIASHHGKNAHRMIDTRWIYHKGMRR